MLFWLFGEVGVVVVNCLLWLAVAAYGCVYLILLVVCLVLLRCYLGWFWFVWGGWADLLFKVMFVGLPLGL